MEHHLDKMPQNKDSTVTLGQLAEAAGVSRSTVSRALKENPVISAGVRQRIQRLAEKMGYRPDPEAARLMTYLKSSRQSRFNSVIGLLNAYVDSKKLKQSEYIADLIDGAMERADQLGNRVSQSLEHFAFIQSIA